MPVGPGDTLVSTLVGATPIVELTLGLPIAGEKPENAAAVFAAVLAALVFTPLTAPIAASMPSGDIDVGAAAMDVGAPSAVTPVPWLPWLPGSPTSPVGAPVGAPVPWLGAPGVPGVPVEVLELLELDDVPGEDAVPGALPGPEVVPALPLPSGLPIKACVIASREPTAGFTGMAPNIALVVGFGRSTLEFLACHALTAASDTASP
jgi:hypothetical protein